MTPAPDALRRLIAEWRDRALLNVADARIGWREAANELEALLSAPGGVVGDRLLMWEPIETAPKDKTLVLVALIRDGVLWRASEAAFNGLGWYTKSGEACHWRTHWVPLPEVRSALPPVETPK